MKRFLASLLVSALATVALAVAGEARAGKVGSEFEVSKSGHYADVATLRKGGFVIVWRRDNASFGIAGQRYDAKGAKAGGPFTVTTSSPEYFTPSVADLSDGGFVVAWEATAGATGLDVFIQRYNAKGGKSGGRIRVNSFTANGQYEPSVAGLANGGFVVTWTSDGQDGATNGIYGQRYGKNGKAVGAAFRVDTTLPTAFHHLSSVAALKNGGFVVVWRGYYGTHAQLYGASGTKVGGEIMVNPTEESLLQHPTVAGLGNGGFVVAREVYSSGANEVDVIGQRFNSGGAKVGSGFRVNSYAKGSQLQPAVAALKNGGFTVVWYSPPQTNAAYGQIYSKAGKAVGKNFKINTSLATIVPEPAVAADGSGFVVAWQSGERYTGIFGQRFAGH